MQRKTKQRSFTTRKARRARRRIALTVAAALAIAVLGLSAWHLDTFHGQVSADTLAPTQAPDETPTASPEASPSDPPAATDAPTDAPSGTPSDAPSAEPGATPAGVPANPMSGGDNPAIAIEEAEHGLLYGVKVGIDPGHQAHANSAQEPVAPGSAETKAKVSSGTQGVSTRVPEYEVNLQVALLLKTALEAQDAEVYLTRDTNDIDISNVERATMMNELGVDVVLRLHCNGSENRSLAGIGLYVKSSGDGAAESYAVSEALIAAMGEATGARTEPIHVRDTYSGLNWSTVPSILVEMGYQSNPEEDQLLASAEYQALLVQGMVSGLVDYFTQHPVPTPTPEPTETPEPSPTPTSSLAPEPAQTREASAPPEETAVPEAAQ